MITITNATGPKQTLAGYQVDGFDVIEISGIGLGVDLNSSLNKELNSYKEWINRLIKQKNPEAFATESAIQELISQAPLVAIAHFLKFPTIIVNVLDYSLANFIIKKNELNTFSLHEFFSQNSPTTILIDILQQSPHLELLYLSKFIFKNSPILMEIKCKLLDKNNLQESLDRLFGEFPTAAFGNCDPFLEFLKNHDVLEENQLMYLLITRQLACLVGNKLPSFLSKIPWTVLISQSIVDENFFDLVELFIQLGANSNETCWLFGGTMLHMLLANEQAAAATMLLKILQKPKANFDFNIQCKAGKTCLMWAAINKNKNLISQLSAIPKIDIDLQDAEGRTALHLAMMMGDLEIIDLLIKSGANLEIVDKQKRTPVDYTKESFTKVDIQKTLDDYGINGDRWVKAPHNCIYGTSGNDLPILVSYQIDQEQFEEPILIAPKNLELINKVQAWYFQNDGHHVLNKINPQIQGMAATDHTLVDFLKTQQANVREQVLINKPFASVVPNISMFQENTMQIVTDNNVSMLQGNATQVVTDIDANANALIHKK